MPIEWNFGDDPSDGMGGEPPSDAGTIRVRNWHEEQGCYGESIHETTISKLIDGVIDGHIEWGGKIRDGEAVAIMYSIKKALQAAIDSIDAVVDKSN